ncbi:MAG: hypothetical protein ACHQF2_09015, partial [Flavobacteriales bacterium]
MRNLFLLISFFVSVQTSAQTDSTYHIKAWGSEPFWTFEFTGTQAAYNSGNGIDSTTTFSLSEHISNDGFTNESVDSYVFTSS